MNYRLYIASGLLFLVGFGGTKLFGVLFVG